MLMLCFCIMRKYALKRALRFSFLFVFFQDVKGEDAAITCIPTCADKERLPLVSRKNDHDNTDEHKEAKIVLTFYVERNPWNNSASSFFSFFFLPAQTLTRNAKIRHCWQLHVLQSQSPIYLSTKDHLCLSLLLFPQFWNVFSRSHPLLSWFFPPAWVSRFAQSCSWPQIRSIYIISTLPVEIQTSDIFSIQYPQAMFRCLINQITVT